MTKTSPDPSARRADLKKRTSSRLMFVQALYQSEHSEDSLHVLGKDFCEDPLKSFLVDEGIVADPAYFKKLLSVFEHDIHLFDERIKGFLTLPWHFERLEPILLSILRAGSAELFSMRDVPEQLIINEYVTLAHGFFHQKEPALVHTILDKMAHLFRHPHETRNETP
ncbi:transcription antitermination factor NusB [bacterium NHP-B]|nr:transcription antitermination factor NusB [bacterium NHP-B]